MIIKRFSDLGENLISDKALKALYSLTFLLSFTGNLQADNSWKIYIYQAAIEEQVPYLLLQEICFRESSGRWYARGPEGYVGLCQVGPLAAKQVLGYIPKPWEFANPIFNAHVAAKYLRWCKNKFRYWTKAINCYNAGPGNVSRFRYAYQYPKGSYTQKIWYVWQENQRRFDFINKLVKLQK